MEHLHITISLSPALESMFTSTLGRMEQKFDAFFAQEQLKMAAIDDAITSLTAQVAANTTITGSVEAFLAGVPKLIADAVAKAIAAGATPAQLKAITDLGTALKVNSDGLAAALVANTTPPVVA